MGPAERRATDVLASPERRSELVQGDEEAFYRSSNGDQWYLIAEPDATD
jgi:hypothetical protein